MSTDFHFLTKPQRNSVPVTFGAPWARGEIKRDDAIRLLDEAGKNIPVQTKPIAFWPDGSVKWTAVSAVAENSGNLKVAVGQPAMPEVPVTIEEKNDVVVIDNGLISCEIGLGDTPIRKLSRSGMSGTSGALRTYLERKEEEFGIVTSKVYALNGNAQKITVEENGPVRALIKIEGVHEPVCKALSLKACYFPFTVRLYVFAGSDEIKIVHTFGIDLDPEKDQLKGVCIELDLPVNGARYNRHVGFVGEEGMFYESALNLFRGGGIWKKVDVLTSSTSPEESQALYERQLRDGQFCTLDPHKNADLIDIISDNAVWNRFILRQITCDSYRISKQTHPGCAVIPAAFGARSNGAIFVGSEGCIISAAVKDFWRKAPMALEVDGLLEDRAKLKIWLCSAYEEAFDFGAYDLVAHMRSYEGGRNNVPEGIANTNEIYLKLFDTMPGKETLIAFAKDAQENILPVADSIVYQNTAVFGNYWRESSDSKHKLIVDQVLRELGEFYLREIEQRRWYGFWDYGDVMHTYDTTRHTWRYDVGGFAWQNTELCNTYMNWLAFLRTMDAEIYRYCAAMSRHCSEVDTYHFGELAPLGSRHNVRHWGCASKEPRISMAGHHRFYYFLTADERMGDVMDLVVDADAAAAKYDIMAITYFGKHEDPRYSHMRVGPDWSSFVSNWMTAWERHEDPIYREKIMAGLRSMAKAPLRMTSGSTFHYDKETGAMHYMEDPEPVGHTHQGDGNYQQNMILIFGAPEIWFELSEWMPDDLFRDMLIEFCDYFVMTPEERKAASNGLFNDDNMDSWGRPDQVSNFCRMYGYTALYGNNERAKALPEEFVNRIGLERFPFYGFIDDNYHLIHTEVSGKDLLRPMKETPKLTTNLAAQGSLNLVESAHFVDLIKKSEK